MSDLFEIRSSELAKEKASDDAVKNFAAKMIQDHSDASQKLKKAITKSDIDVKIPSSLDDAHQQKLDKLKGLDGDAFEKSYLTMQVEGHEKAVELQKSYAHNGDNGELRALAGTLIPLIEAHLQMVKKLNAQHP